MSRFRPIGTGNKKPRCAICKKLGSPKKPLIKNYPLPNGIDDEPWMGKEVHSACMGKRIDELASSYHSRKSLGRIFSRLSALRPSVHGVAVGGPFPRLDVSSES